MAELIIEWSSADPKLAALLRSVADLHGPARWAAEAALHTFQAQQCNALIGAYEANRRDSERRSRRARETRQRKRAHPPASPPEEQP